MGDNKLLGNDISCVVIDEIALERSDDTDCMDCRNFSGGVMDFPYCKLKKIPTYFCRHYVPLGKRGKDDRVWC